MTLSCLPNFTVNLLQAPDGDFDSYFSNPRIKYSLFGLNVLTVGASRGDAL
jgi:hypothetical protein